MENGSGAPAVREFLAAVRENGLTLEKVPARHRTYELCLEAVRQNGFALQHVPTRHRKEELCLTAIGSNPIAVYHTPVYLYTEDFVVRAVRASGRALAYFREDLRTPWVCFEAVLSDRDAILSVPTRLKVPILRALGEGG